LESILIPASEVEYVELEKPEKDIVAVSEQLAEIQKPLIELHKETDDAREHTGTGNGAAINGVFEKHRSTTGEHHLSRSTGNGNGSDDDAPD
jgi:hypothetical protein